MKNIVKKISKYLMVSIFSVMLFISFVFLSKDYSFLSKLNSNVESVSVSFEVLKEIDSNDKDLQKTDSIDEDLKKINYTNNHIKEDLEYLKSIDTKDTTRLTNEIKELEAEINNIIKTEGVEVNSVHIYDFASTRNIHYLSSMIKNRKKIIKGINAKDLDLNNFINLYESSVEQEIDGDLTSEERDQLFDYAKKVVSNLKIKESELEGLKIFISPYQLKGVNGLFFRKLVFSGDKEQRYESIIIANSKEFKYLNSTETFRYTDEEYEVIAKGTILHEIGHFIDRRKGGISSSPEYAESFKVIDENIKDEWRNSVTENYAEDFRYYMATKLGKESFSPRDKQTNYEYNEVFVKESIKDIILE